MNSRLQRGLLLALITLLVVPGGASAARRFMGVSADGLSFGNPSLLSSGLRSMNKRGVTSLRVSFYWRLAQPYAQMSDVPAAQRSRFVEVDGRPTDFGPTDIAVSAAAKRGITVLPVVIGVPSWASTDSGKAFAPPKSAKTFGRFAGTLAKRYGPKGTFWKDNPSVPRLPIRDWQIWNEPAGLAGFKDYTIFWQLATPTTPPGEQGMRDYIAMVKASRSYVRRADSRARIVLAGFFGQSWLAIGEIYQAGARKLFDVVAIHPYASSVTDVVRIADMVRDVMSENGDSRKSLLLTEFGWSSSRGKTAQNPQSYLESTKNGQASLVRKAYSTLWAARARLRLRAAYWYNWASRDLSPYAPFDYVGLNRRKPDGTIVAKPAAVAYAKVAKKLR